MCGIVGYVGQRDAADVLMDGLSRLEYRGYDSAGIAVFENEIIKVAKSKGRLADLQVKMEKEGKPAVMPELVIPDGRHMENLPTGILILTGEGMSHWYTMVLLKTIKN